MTLVCLALVGVSFVLSAAMTRMLTGLGHRIGTLDAHGVPGHVKPDLRRVPNIGGVAIFWAAVLPVCGALAAVHIGVDTDVWPWSGVSEHIPGIREQTASALLLVVCMGMLHVVGIVDDRRPLGPLPKLVVMFGAAVAVVLLTGSRLLTVLDPHVGGAWLSIALTVLWIVLVTNAMNFLDNMDGLCAGVAAIAGALFLGATLVQGQWFVAAMLAVLVGSVLGFLVFNAPPARIFMGDGGSLVIGFLLAFLTVRTTYYAAPGSTEAALLHDAPSVWYGVFMPMIVLAIPLYDFVTVTVIRLRQGHSPFVGDTRHFSHRLVQRGLSRRAAVVVIWALTLVTGISGVSLGSLEGWQAVLVGVQTCAALLVLAIFEFAPRDRAV